MGRDFHDAYPMATPSELRDGLRDGSVTLCPNESLTGTALESLLWRCLMREPVRGQPADPPVKTLNILKIGTRGHVPVMIADIAQMGPDGTVTCATREIRICGHCPIGPRCAYART